MAGPVEELQMEDFTVVERRPVSLRAIEKNAREEIAVFGRQLVF